MIFDEGTQASGVCELDALQPRSRPPIETSMDDYLQERRLKLEKRDLSQLYHTYKLVINKNYFKSNTRQPQSGENRRRRIEKGRETSRAKNDITPRIRSLNTVSLRAKKPFVSETLENIKELNSPDSQLELTETADEVQNASSDRKGLGGFCSMHNIEQHPASLLDVSFDCHRPCPAARGSFPWGKENISTLKSFESLDSQPRCSRESRVAFDDSCSICCRHFGFKASIAITQRCGHIFHESCFTRWVLKNCKTLEEKCPKCSSNL